VGVLAVVVFATLVFLFLREAHESLGTFDSEVANVPRQVIDNRLQMWMGVRLPSSARDIHVLTYGGLAPMMAIRFTAKPDEASLFAQQALAHGGYSEVVLRLGSPPAWLDELIQKEWWKPKPGVPWWGYADADTKLFVQTDPLTGLVYFALHLR
jgi:hypothetical protein